MLEFYDAFSINPIMFLEDLGFCTKGEGGPFVEDGGTAPGGRSPVNTNGGGLSCVHPDIYGIFTIIEAVQQLRGACGAHQVPDAATAISHGNGGHFSNQVPQTLIAVRHMSRMRSTPMMSAMPAGGVPTGLSTIARMTMPTPGAAGVLIEAPTAVTTISAMSAKLISTPNTWARKIAATP